MSVELFDAVRVEIRDDYELVRAFIQWQLDTGTYGFRGSSSGLGNSTDTFPAEYKPQLEAFFSGR